MSIGSTVSGAHDREVKQTKRQIHKREIITENQSTASQEENHTRAVSNDQQNCKSHTKMKIENADPNNGTAKK